MGKQMFLQISGARVNCYYPYRGQSRKLSESQTYLCTLRKDLAIPVLRIYFQTYLHMYKIIALFT